MDTDFLSQKVNRDGFAYLKSWHPEKSTSSLAIGVGRTLKCGNTGPVTRLLPKSLAPSNSYSGIYGLNAFPLHTDMAHWRNPPRYIMLRCVCGDQDVSTNIVDGCQIVEQIGLNILARTLVKPRRPLDGSIQLLTVYRPQYGVVPGLLRWDEKFIVPASSQGERGMALFRRALKAVSVQEIRLANSGDTLFLDNWRMLHGRSEVLRPDTGRLLERAYLGDLI